MGAPAGMPADDYLDSIGHLFCGLTANSFELGFVNKIASRINTFYAKELI